MSHETRSTLWGPRWNPAKRFQWGKEEQGSGRSFRREAETELSGLCDDAGQRLLRMSAYDKAALAIRDGELGAFRELYPQTLPDHADDLLIKAAGRPGEIGRKMTHLLLSDVEHFSEEAYRAACLNAIDTSDLEKVKLFLSEAEDHVEDLSPSFQGDMACCAYTEHRAIAKEIIEQCSNEQIAAAPPVLMELFASDPDLQTMSTLVEKGFSRGPGEWRTLHMLTYENRNSWMAELLLKKRMWVDPCDYGALHSCVKNNAVGVAKLLLDGGINFDDYRQRFPEGGSEETIRALEEHWQTIQAQAQEQEQEAEGPQMGGMSLG